MVQLREVTVEPGLLRRLARCLTLVGPLANGSCEVVDEQVDALFQVKVFPSSTLHDSVDNKRWMSNAFILFRGLFHNKLFVLDLVTLIHRYRTALLGFMNSTNLGTYYDGEKQL